MMNATCKKKTDADPYVFSFDDGDGKDKQLLGGKGANLCEMTQIGLNVPPGFGVGKLMELAVGWRRRQKPDMRIGICGEHGGHPQSIAFCHSIGLSYVSCSASRVPIARLAVAQAALQPVDEDTAIINAIHLKGRKMKYGRISNFKRAVVALLTVAVLTGNSSRADVGAGEEWVVDPNFHGKKARFELSGAVCAGVQAVRNWCLAVNDEKKYAQFFSIAGTKLVPAKRIRLLPKSEGEEAFGEIDAEAAAYYDGFVYVTGSHGLSRKLSRFRRSQFFVFRFPVGRETGAPGFDFDDKNVSSKIERSDRLRAIIQRNSVIGPYGEHSLSVNGANIEGLAVNSDGMHFGFRAPSLDGEAIIMTLGIDALFGNMAPDASITKLKVGYGIGIRDLAATSFGILVLAGPAGGENFTSSIYLWNPAFNRLNRLGELPGVSEAKAETLLLLNESSGPVAGSFDVLVLYDGLKNGGPREFRLKIK